MKGKNRSSFNELGCPPNRDGRLLCFHRRSYPNLTELEHECLEFLYYAFFILLQTFQPFILQKSRMNELDSIHTSEFAY